MISQDVVIPVETFSMSAYLARPAEGSGTHPAVIVLQEVFGLTPETKRVTDLLAGLGYVGLAINYHHRIDPQMNEPYTEEGRTRAFAAAASVTPGNVLTDVRAALTWLNSQSFVKPGKTALLGFGFGASAAFLATEMRELSGAILFYPANIAAPLPSGGAPPLERAAQVQIPLLVIFGEQDYFVSRSDMNRIHTTLKSANKDVRVQIYPHVGHSFFRHGRPQAIEELKRYSDEAVAHAVADSWNLVKAFLDEVLNRSPHSASETGDIRTLRTPSVRA